MKKLFIILLSLFAFSQFSQAQLIVSDPGVYAKLLEQTNNTLKTIEKATKTLEVSEKNLEIVKNANEKLKKVKSAISQGKMIKKIISNFDVIGKELIEISKQISSLKEERYVTRYTEKYQDLSDELDILSELVTQTLTGSMLEATDIDRLKYLNELYNSTKGLKDTTESLNSEIFFRM